MAKNKYRLYALGVKKESVEIAYNERFNRITPEYILIYTNGKKPKKSVEITEDEVFRLSNADNEWLFYCNLTIINEETKKQKSSIIESIGERMNQLEKELESEKKKLDGAN